MSAELFGNVQKISFYPVKSAAAVEVRSAILTPEGIEGDRQFMVVHASPDSQGVHEFVTQRAFRGEHKPQSMSIMALIKPQLVEGDLILTWNGQDPIEVPGLNTGRELAVRIHGQEYHGAVDQGEYLSRWLSEHLDLPVNLVMAAGSLDRLSSQNYIPNDNPLGFQDGYPIHWFSQASVDELSKVAGEIILWQTFRPNIVVSGSPAQSEHVLYSGEIAGIPFIDPKPCDRCPITNVDQETGEVKVGRVLGALSNYKRWKNIRGEQKVIFGENMLPQGEGVISIGDEIVLMDRRIPPLVYGAKV